MTHGRKTLICVLSGLSACSLATSALGNTDNPYKAIIDRNVFGLKPPPPPPDPNAEAAKTPPPKITLTGISTILGNKRALMKTPPGPVKPGEQPREQSYVLAEGQRDGDMEVVQIDEAEGSVKVTYAGQPLTLTFEKDGVKPGPSGAPGGLPSPAGLPNPAGIRAHFPGTDGSIRALPTRTMRLSPPAGGSPTGAAMQPGGANYQASAAGSYQPASYQSAVGAGAVPQGQYNPGYGAMPGGVALNTAAGGMSLTGPPATAAKLPPNWPPDMNLSGDEQLAMMHLQQEANKDNPNFPGFPGISNPHQPQQQQEQQVQPDQTPNQNGFPFPPPMPGLPPR